MQKQMTYIVFAIFALTLTVLSIDTYAQVVHFPDPNLRAAVAEKIGVDPDRITQAALQRLARLGVLDREIENLEGLQYASNLRLLNLSSNRISDLTPLANLHSLEELELDKNVIKDVSPLAGLTNLLVLTLRRNLITDIEPLRDLTRLQVLIIEHNSITDISPLGRLTNLRILKMPYNSISDLTPLANLTNLEELLLNENRISDISPLAGLTNLRVLNIGNNLITNVKALSGLTRLRLLAIEENLITDHAPLDGLSITDFTYDQTCDMPPFELESRLKNRTFPSVFAPWKSTINQPHLSVVKNYAQHDLFFSGLIFKHHFFDTGETWELRGEPGRGEKLRAELTALNPNMIFLVEIRNKSARFGTVPEDSPYWLKDANGKFVFSGRDYYEVDVTHPVAQEIIINQALAVARCGLYDGIFFDHWGDSENPSARGRALNNIIERIRVEARPDFLIMGNTNDNKIPRTAEYTNGGFMETLVPHNLTGESLEEGLTRIEDALLWLETNLKEPRINGLEGFSVPTEPPDSPTNLRWMRAITTMSLTHSDGYVLFNDGVSHYHYWYDFWDADLGRPLSEAKAQLFENREGLYIREFTNGWAAYNHSGKPQIIKLPEEAQGVASGLVNTAHALPNLDGEMYLRVKPKNPADVNGDGVVNILDLTLVAQAFGKDGLQGDVNGDGVINVFDLVFVANQF